MNNNYFFELKSLFEELLKSLSTERQYRNNWINKELEWVTYERMHMYDLINNRGACLEKKKINLSEVIKAERLAFGHSDYSSKFSLYCAELVLKD